MSTVEVLEDAHHLSFEEFVRRFETPSRPCILRGLTSDWPSCQRDSDRQWTIARLEQRFPRHRWDLGTEDNVAITLPEFIENCSRRSSLSSSNLSSSSTTDHPVRDPAPALPSPAPYIFDADYGADVPELLSEYSIPRMFPGDADDFLAFVSDRISLRPRYRWLLIGSVGSGFTIHQDPFDSSAWNALISGPGHKRWVLLPPSTPLTLILPSQATNAGSAQRIVCIYIIII